MIAVIGIGGLKRSGKNTFARVLGEVAQKQGFVFASIAMADPLRAAAAAAYGVALADFTNDAKKDTTNEAWGISPRQMLINLGEALRSVDHNHWVKTWRRAVAAIVSPLYSDQGNASTARLYEQTVRRPPYRHDTIVAVPDIRRVNEAAAVHQMGGVNVLITRAVLGEWNGHHTESLAYLAAQDAQRFVYSDERHAAADFGKGKPIFDLTVTNDATPEALRVAAELVIRRAVQK